ncbi:unnamed protein product [Heligmosomoides polygyrus]|uniref:Uncharacterized protein n=1 Tax=Heligmosomoides polygyrus TaxID=6339 RepID=A0A3P8B473_HELPZ|nr:unnamed protein product [Heligmosomoides polygyrus]
MKKMKPGKATGPDDLAADVWKSKLWYPAEWLITSHALFLLRWTTATTGRRPAAVPPPQAASTSKERDAANRKRKKAGRATKLSVVIHK